MGKEITIYKESLDRNGCLARVNRVGSRLFLDVEWKVDGASHRFPLPDFFQSQDELPDRSLSVNWEVNPKNTRDVYSLLLEGLYTYISIEYPGFWVETPVKVYADIPHDDPDESSHHFVYVPVIHFLTELEELAAQKTRETSKLWVGAISNVVFVVPETGYNFDKGWVPTFPSEMGWPYRLMFPAVDFDIDNSGDPHHDLADVVKKLSANGFSGWLIQSGDSPSGGYQYLADFMLPYNPNYWQVLGMFMNLFTDQNRADLISVAGNLSTANTLNQAREIVETIGLDPNRVDKRSWPVSDVDWGWCYHQVREGMSKLRTTKGKNYKSAPKVVAEIR